MKLQSSQLLPSSTEIKDEATKNWADKITFFLDNVLRKIAKIPFNQSETLENEDTGTADTEFSLTHHLNRTPTGFILARSDKACSLYDSGTAWTDSKIYLKCDAADVNIKILIF